MGHRPAEDAEVTGQAHGFQALQTRHPVRWVRSSGEQVAIESMNDLHLCAAFNKCARLQAALAAEIRARGLELHDDPPSGCLRARVTRRPSPLEEPAS